MIHVRFGDQLPIVAAVQLLLNARLPDRTPLKIDGNFGPRTQQAVVTFQDRSGLRADGGVGPMTWNQLTTDHRLEVRDIIDVFDPILEESEQVVQEVGSRPIRLGGGSNAVGWVVPAVAGSGVSAGSLVLLRFQGHGNQGTQAIGYGTGIHVLYDVLRREPVPPLRQFSWRTANITSEEDESVREVISRSSISLRSLQLRDVVTALRPLRDYFAESGSVEFHGCRVGGGEDGAQFLQEVADLFGVPAVAAQQSQTTLNAIRFRGPIRVACPGRVSLRQWAARLMPVFSCFR